MRMMPLKSPMLGIMLLLLIDSVRGASYDANIQMQESIKGIVNIVQALRSTIQQKGAQDVRSADSRITFNVQESPIPAASQLNGTIEYSNSLDVLFLYIGDVAVESSRSRSFVRCAFAYNEYLLRTVSKNANLFANKQPLLFIQPPEQFVAQAQPLCAGSEHAFPLPEHLRGTRNERVISMTVFVYLHELGHYFLQHQGVSTATLQAALKGTTTPQILSELGRSREQESSADAWAVRQFFQIIGPDMRFMVFDLPQTLYIMGGGYDCSHTPTSTHPDGFDRFVALIPVIRKEYKHVVGVDIDEPINSLLSDYVTLAERTHEAFSCGDATVPVEIQPRDYGNCYTEQRCFGSPFKFKPK
jgi:hypothetical protein